MRILIVTALIVVALSILGCILYACNIPLWAAGIGVLSLAPLTLVGYYIVWWLAKHDILLTEVQRGWCKIILHKGNFSRIIGPGWHWMGLPGINTLYRRTMTFLKSVTDKDGKPQAEPHDDKDISRFKTTRYPYAIPFKDEEDSKGLPLSGFLAVDGIVEDYEKAFFVMSDWYAEVMTRILACWRKVLVNVSYDDDIVGRDKKEEQARKTISELLREELNLRQNGNPSIIDELREVVGFRIFSIELRSIDPPPDWRAITLAPYKAEREKAAAVHQAQTSAILLDDTNQALEAWKKIHPSASPEQITEKQQELARRAYLKAGGQYNEIHGLEAANVVSFGGGGNAGGVGVLVGGSRQQNSEKKGGKKTKPSEMTNQELQDEYNKMLERNQGKD